jgi:hypothetical protein
MTEASDKLCAFRCGKPAHQIAKMGAKGKVIYETKRLCLEHLVHQRIKMAEYRVTRKKKGLCSRCGNKARKMPGGSYSFLCQGCRDHVRELESSTREAAR